MIYIVLLTIRVARISAGYNSKRNLRLDGQVGWVNAASRDYGINRITKFPIIKAVLFKIDLMPQSCVAQLISLSKRLP